MSDNLPPLPGHPEHGWVWTEAEQRAIRAYAAAAVAAERERCAHAAGEYAKKWWHRHCATNKHMTTTREAHEDFCSLQRAIRAATPEVPR